MPQVLMFGKGRPRPPRQVQRIAVPRSVPDAKVLKGKISHLRMTDIRPHRRIQRDRKIVRRQTRLQGTILGVDPKRVLAAIHAAVQSSHIGIVDLLLDYGAPLHVGHPTTGRTALHEAIMEGERSMVQTLLTRGAPLDRGDVWGRTALHDAVKTRDGSMIQTLLTRGPPVDKADIWGLTALHDACQQGNQDIIWMLLNNGADCNIHDIHQCSPLLWAVWNRDHELVRMLLENGAKVEIDKSTLCTSELWVVHRVSESIRLLFVEYGLIPGENPLHIVNHVGDANKEEHELSIATSPASSVKLGHWGAPLVGI